MARVTADEVAAIIEVDSSISMAPFIELASLLVDEELLPLGTLSTPRLVQIEKWLAAHFYAIRDPRVSSEGVAGLSLSYARGSQTTRFESTTYGQQALALDSTGTLLSLNAGGAKLAFAFLGSTQ